MSGKLNAVVGQSGGPTSVINQSLVGVIEQLRKESHIDQLLGSRYGVRGIIDEKFISLKDVDPALLERIADTPAAALGSTRDKPDHAYCEKILKVFQKNNVRYFFYIGGNDSADTARIVHSLANEEHYDLRVFHIPKTVDNDLRVHDHTPGYGSAARYVAHAVLGDNFDNASLPGVKIDVIMGRNAGFLTAASVLARRHPEDGPHLIYVPETPVSEDKVLADIDAVYKKRGRCLICVSEGLSDAPGKTWTERIAHGLEVDMHKNIQLSGVGALADYISELVRTKLGVKRVRADTFGYPQRSFPGLTSTVDSREARLVGQVAAHMSLDPSILQGSIAMRRISDSPYQIETFLTPLETVAKETKHLPAAYIRNGNDITEDFRKYAGPLIGELPQVGSFEELGH